MKSIQSTLSLNNGVEIPYLGLGTFRAKGEECQQAVTTALNHGYLSIDTAQAYENETLVGKGWKASSLHRDEIFITTKISNPNQGYESSIETFKQSLKDLQTDYVDLLLVHWPDMKDFERSIATYKALIHLQEKGLCRSIGVSNFTISLTEKIISETGVVPAANQVEFHSFLYQKELLAYCREKEIQIEAYCPIARAKFFDHEQLQQIAQKHQQTPAQVMLAWGVKHDLVVIPKSVNEDRIKENADIFFELDDEDMKIINNLSPQTRLVNGPWAPPEWNE